jgi:hypothetical protein
MRWRPKVSQPLRLGAGRTLTSAGSTNMGEVYLVKHPRLPRHDTLKILPAHVSADTAKPIWRPRFIIRTLSVYTTEASSMASCGSQWTTSRAPTPPN